MALGCYFPDLKAGTSFVAEQSQFILLFSVSSLRSSFTIKSTWQQRLLPRGNRECPLILIALYLISLTNFANPDYVEREVIQINLAILVLFAVSYFHVIISGFPSPLAVTCRRRFFFHEPLVTFNRSGDSFWIRVNSPMLCYKNWRPFHKKKSNLLSSLSTLELMSFHCTRQTLPRLLYYSEFQLWLTQKTLQTLRIINRLSFNFTSKLSVHKSYIYLP